MASVSADGPTQRVRSRQLARVTVAVFVVAVAAVTGVVIVRGETSRSSLIDQALAVNPPVGGHPTVVGRFQPDWTTVVWGRTQGGWCTMTYQNNANESFSCWPSASLTQADASATGSLSVPVYPQLPGFVFGRLSSSAPGGTLCNGSVRLFPVVGLVSGHATRVTVTVLGCTFNANVLRVPSEGPDGIGAYEAWVVGGGSVTDITGIVAYDEAGTVVARHGPWH